MENPNEYDEIAYSRARIEVNSAIGQIWDAGAALDEIQDDLAEAIENATGHGVVVGVVVS